MKAELGTHGLISTFVGPSAAPRLYHGVVGGGCRWRTAGWKLQFGYCGWRTAGWRLQVESGSDQGRFPLHPQFDQCGLDHVSPTSTCWSSSCISLSLESQLQTSHSLLRELSALHRISSSCSDISSSLGCDGVFFCASASAVVNPAGESPFPPPGASL